MATPRIDAAPLLTWLELEHNQLTDGACAAARGLAKHVNVGAQEPPDGDHDGAPDEA